MSNFFGNLPVFNSFFLLQWGERGLRKINYFGYMKSHPSPECWSTVRHSCTFECVLTMLASHVLLGWHSQQSWNEIYTNGYSKIDRQRPSPRIRCAVRFKYGCDCVEKWQRQQECGRLEQILRVPKYFRRSDFCLLNRKVDAEWRTMASLPKRCAIDRVFRSILVLIHLYFTEMTFLSLPLEIDKIFM